MLSDSLRNALESALGDRISAARAFVGGQIARTLLVRCGRVDVVVKHDPDSPAGLFAAEAAGLALLGSIGVIRTPAVLAISDAPETQAGDRFLAMEYVRPDPKPGPEFGRLFGRRLAEMHIQGRSTSGLFGLAADNFIGRARQDNSWTENWCEFYVRRRIAPALQAAAPNLGSAARRVERLSSKAGDILGGMSGAPALIHGDLWSGNFLASGGRPVLIDPAAYFGHPEIEWAYIDLFGGFPEGMRGGYDRIRPFDPGYESRRPLLQLYHLLLHVAHFGQRYVPAVEDVCRGYGE